MLGAPARIETIVAIAAEHGIPVLEDTAQAAGCRIRGRHVGTFGTCGTFSFDSVKTITTGEGGMIITDDGRALAVNVGISGSWPRPQSQSRRQGRRESDVLSALTIE